uniref:Uncharacterized protein n=1 Tax=Rhizophora mucronata TaxID=61149 RepID=A0A2P2NB27_RHIMU
MCPTEPIPILDKCTQSSMEKNKSQGQMVQYNPEGGKSRNKITWSCKR